MGDSTLRIGIIGTGVIAWAHALSLRALIRAGLIDAEILLVFDRDQDRAADFAKRNRAAAVASAEQVAAGVDAVYVCTSTKGHLAAVRAAAAASRAIFCEKPLARSLAESHELATVATDAGVPVQVGLVLRTAPIYTRLAGLVASGELGRPMTAVFRDDQFFPIQGHYASTWRGDSDEAGSGTLLEHAIHDVDIIRACFGTVGSASALITNTAGYDRIEDTVVATLDLGGVPVCLVSVWHEVMSRPSTRRAEIFFERGFVVLEDDFDGPLSVQTDEGVELRPCPAPDWVMEVPVPEGQVGLAIRPYIEENRRFIDTLVAGTVPWPGLGEALAAHAVVDACYRSAADGGGPVAGPW
jgi:predicted dehydrogenase